jgi:hypothetical protein
MGQYSHVWAVRLLITQQGNEGAVLLNVNKLRLDALACINLRVSGQFTMNNSISVTRLLTIFFLGLVFTVLAACSSGNTDTTNTASGPGSVALLLTDAPSDDFDEINITVVKAELMSDHGQVTIFQGEDTFNLLDLTDARIFAIREGIPGGSYNKIRLTLKDNGIELVDFNDTDDPTDDAVYYPKLPGNNKLDLNPRGSFSVVAGTTLVIQIDMDASKSIHIVKKGKKDEYNFRPVVFIDIVTDAFIERFVKLHGDIFAINTVDQSFKLCNTGIPVRTGQDVMKTGSRGCVRVETDSTTAFFDINGMPAAFSSLIEGEPATVFGHLQYDRQIENDDERELRDLVLKAALIELGPESSFQKLNGTATSAVDINNQFTMDVDPGQGLTTPLILLVQIQQGTLLINRKGQTVTVADIITGKLVSARGVLDVSKDILFASVIVVDTDSSTQLTGTVGANPDNICGFSLVTATGDRSIHTGSNTNAYLVANGVSKPIDVSELSTGQQADVYGNANVNGCFDAHTIISY